MFFAVVLCSVVQTDGDADSADDYDCGGDYDGGDDDDDYYGGNDGDDDDG